jgi:hypothetical protein
MPLLPPVWLGYGWWAACSCGGIAWVLWMRFGGGRLVAERPLGKDRGGGEDAKAEALAYLRSEFLRSL